ncbi:hypothetical protein BC829DRAFT_397974, partial [Chytridium lagenaria]
MMGQGEPLLNFKNVALASKLLFSALGMSPWRMTLSTSGVAPMIPRVASELGCSLAISLHSPENSLRDVLVPLNKQYPINEVMKSVRRYIQLMPAGRHKRVTFECVDIILIDMLCFRDVNDSVSMAKDVATLLKGLPAHVNLIPFNPWPGTKYETSSREAIIKFQNVLLDRNIACNIRHTRGDDVLAACGQLRSSEERKREFFKKGTKKG